ncbi:MAG: hypothetical protein AAF645_22655 [Myxococcota bacterium]
MAWPLAVGVALSGCGIFGGEPTTPQQALIEEGIIDEELVAFVETRYGCGFEPIIRDSQETVRYEVAIDGLVCGERRRFVKLEVHGWVDVTPIDPIDEPAPITAEAGVNQEGSAGPDASGVDDGVIVDDAAVDDGAAAPALPDESAF